MFHRIVLGSWIVQVERVGKLGFHPLSTRRIFLTFENFGKDHIALKKF